MLSDFQTVHFKAGETIFNEGEQGDCAYVVISGNVLVQKNSDENKIVLAELGQNQMIGEMALISPGHRTASVVAQTDSTLLLIEQNQFTHRRSKLDPILKMVYEVIMGRFRNTLHSVETLKPGAQASNIITKEMAAALDALRLETDIKRGIAENEFCFHYQPIINLRSGRISGAEALIRWQHPTHGLLMPGSFIPNAEMANLIGELTCFAVSKACEVVTEFDQASQSNPGNVDPMFITVNLSGRDFETGILCDHLLHSIDRYSVDPSRLKLEITETSLMGDMERTCSYMAKLKEGGLKFAIDDFGTGYSSMSYLTSMPLSTLKIDRSFVTNLEQSQQSQKVISAILRLADELGLSTVAEGIESKAEAAFLRKSECTYGQGYYFSKPLPLPDFLQLAENWNRIQSRADVSSERYERHG
ncbi:MAG: EAL domain-containing protein [Rhizobiaceae bacterium]|nr:EAL domain-containing protein [Rhizobiaceae bacterium]